MPGIPWNSVYVLDVTIIRYLDSVRRLIVKVDYTSFHKIKDISGQENIMNFFWIIAWWWPIAKCVNIKVNIKSKFEISKNLNQMSRIQDMYKKVCIFIEMQNLWIYYYTTNINGLLNSSFRLDGWFLVRISKIFGNGKWLHFKMNITPTLNDLHPTQNHRIGHYIPMINGLLNPSFWLDWRSRSLKNEKWMRFKFMIIKA